MPPNTRRIPYTLRIYKTASSTKTIKQAKRLLPSALAKLHALERNLTDGSSAQVMWESTMSVLSSCLHQMESLQSKLEVATTQNTYMMSMHETCYLLKLYLKPFTALAMQKKRLRMGEYHKFWEAEGGLLTHNCVTEDVEAKILALYQMKLRYSYPK